ncbi:unnamed protein product [Adineta steineri]|uniref:Tubby C-terminal domain-containing protein n=1 Tax=Adineta steineri TaxID=433720 RepID=A0A814QJZ5_9BILA|nr:unnamed protein product [Adineta steineri]
MYHSDHEDETIVSSTSKNSSRFVDDDFVVHLTNSKRFYRNPVDDDYDDEVENDDDEEEGFTNLQFCEIPVDTDSESSRSCSPIILQKQDNISENNIVQQCTACSNSMNSDDLRSCDNILHLLENDPYKFIFTPIPKQNKDYTRCRVIRDKSVSSEIYYLELEPENSEKPIPILTAKKEKRMLGQFQYLISLDSNFDNNFYSAELISSNVLGTKYILYDLNGDEHQELATIIYESNFLGLGGPRKLDVFLPKLDHQLQPLLKQDEIEEYDSVEQNDSCVRLYNTIPVWDEETETYVVYFDGNSRITLPSIKNFQMVIANKNHTEEIVMEFGRISDNEFSCDFRYPLSIVQAFSIALSSFETRLFRE